MDSARLRCLISGATKGAVPRLDFFIVISSPIEWRAKALGEVESSGFGCLQSIVALLVAYAGKMDNLYVLLLSKYSTVSGNDGNSTAESYYLSVFLQKIIMIRLLPFFILSTGLCYSCNENSVVKQPTREVAEAGSTTHQQQERHFRGAFSNGMKGDSISFDISADGTTLSNLTFKGYWRCSGTLESVTAGPEGSFTIIDNKVNDHIAEPPGGGSTAWRFDLQADINGNTAQGSFRMNINNLGCDSYKLKWTANVQ